MTPGSPGGSTTSTAPGSRPGPGLSDGPTLSAPPALSRAVVDRSASRRRDASWLEAAWASAGTGVLVLWQGTVGVTDDGDRVRLATVAPAAAPPGERYLLGEEDGRAWFAVDATASTSAPPLPPGARPAGLRDVGALLDDRDAGLLTHAVALAAWHERSQHCPRCGGRTHPESAGAAGRCEVCGTEHHPRTDPAVIMLVHDGGDRCVLGRQPGWQPGLVSTLAGFVEPGESAEMAVVREVGEEVGLSVDQASVVYLGSQPWPFPASLMLAYRAQAADAPLVVDLEELESAAWWSRRQVREALADGTVQLPSPVSIAHRLIRGWLDGDESRQDG
jgi:NAD+ diphosphatase